MRVSEVKEDALGGGERARHVQQSGHVYMNGNF